MIEINAQEHSDIVEVTIDGDISKEDFDDIVSKLEAVIAQHGRVKILEHVRSMGKIPPSRVIKDIQFVFQHRKDFSRAAVVGDQKVLTLLTKVAGKLLGGKVKHFKESDIDEARAWLSAA